jgi:hypothetical protein
MVHDRVLPCLIVGAASLAATSAFAAPPCQFTPPLTTQTKCVTAVPVGPAPLLSYDISFVNPDRGEYYLADRSNKSIDIINTKTLTLVRQLTGFAGNNDTAGPVAQLEVLNALRASLAEGEMSLPVGHRARRPRPRDG